MTDVSVISDYVFFFPEFSIVESAVFYCFLLAVMSYTYVAGFEGKEQSSE